MYFKIPFITKDPRTSNILRIVYRSFFMKGLLRQGSVSLHYLMGWENMLEFA